MPRRAQRRPDAEGQVELELDGKKYSGSYVLEGHLVTVRYRFHSASTQVGGLPRQDVAELLLAELVHEHG